MRLLSGHSGISIRADEAMTARPIEIDFLRECLRCGLVKTETPVRELPDSSLSVPRNLDWSVLLALAEENRVTAMVYPALASMAPEPFAAAWRTGWFNAELLATELESLLDAFAERGIEVMPLKGPVLAEALYGTGQRGRRAIWICWLRAGSFPRQRPCCWSWAMSQSRPAELISIRPSISQTPWSSCTGAWESQDAVRWIRKKSGAGRPPGHLACERCARWPKRTWYFTSAITC